MRCSFRSSIAVVSLVSSALAADLPSFEAASVKHSDPNAKSLGANTCTGGPGTSDPGMLHCTNSSLALLTMLAYDVKWYKLVSPDWVIHGGSESGYDVSAKIPAGTSKADYRLMLQHLLADRFHLVVHREDRELPVYSLVAGKGAPRMVLSSTPAPPGPRCAMSFAGNHFPLGVPQHPHEGLLGIWSLSFERTWWRTRPGSPGSTTLNWISFRRNHGSPKSVGRHRAR